MAAEFLNKCLYPGRPGVLMGKPSVPVFVESLPEVAATLSGL
jgi:hypothetical protein